MSQAPYPVRGQTPWDTELKNYIDSGDAGSSGGPGPAGGVLSGSYPNPGFAVDMATQAELNAVSSAVTARQLASQKGQPNGYASLGADGLVPENQLPEVEAAWMRMTQAEYDALPVKDPDTLYVIVG